MKTLRWIAVVAGVCMAGPAAALDAITNYSTTANDRFASGFPASPVPNTSPSFVGAAYDWSGVGWSTTTYAASSYKGFALLSPRHFLTAQHYENGGLLTQGVNVLGKDGTVSTGSNTGISNLGYGAVVTNVGVTAPDLAVGTLAAPITTPGNMTRYAVLDLFSTSSSTTYSDYNGLSLLAYGRGATTNGSPRVGAATVLSAQLATSTNAFTPVILTSRSGSTSVQVVEGDSGSPLMHGWTNPNGDRELTVLGLNTGYTTDNLYNVMSMLAAPGAMANATDTMALTGYALRVAGPTSNTWVGSSSTSIGNRGAWGLSAPASAPSDKYVLFDAATAGSGRNVTVDSNRGLRGLYFKATATEGDGFTFAGASTLTIGRGGLTNYDNARQTFTASLALGDTQYWDVGAGGVTAGAINTSGWLLEIAGSGTARITGAVSGTGGLALSGHRLELTGSSTYTGRTWVHSGKLVVNGNIAASSGVTLDAGAELGGSGRVGAISGSGAVGPGNSPGILTATSVDAAGGLDFNFEFGWTGAPTWSSATASGNDVLRLTGGTPFTQPLTAANVIDIFLGVQSVRLGSTFLGGFFTDASADFWGSLQNAKFQYYVLGDGLGTAKSYNDQGYYLLDTNFWADFERVEVSTVSVASAGFADGAVTDGRVMQMVVVPEPSAAVMVGVALVVGVGWYRRRGRTS